MLTGQQCLLLQTVGTTAQRSKAPASSGVTPDKIWHLLTTAVYTSNEDPQRQQAVHQLSGIRESLLDPPGVTNPVAIFSTRQGSSHMARYADCCW